MPEDWSQYAVSDKSDDKGTDWSQYAVKEEQKPSFLDSVVNKTSEILANHPRIREIAERALTGTSPEFEKTKQEMGITGVLGPSLQEIPGTRKVSDEIRKEGLTSGDYWKGFRASLYGDLVDLAGSGFDPRAATRDMSENFLGPNTETRPSRLLPSAEGRTRFYSPDNGPNVGSPSEGTLDVRQGISYDYPESGHKFYTMPDEAKPIDVTPIRKATREVQPTAGEDIKPPIDVARDFAPVGEEGDLAIRPKEDSAKTIKNDDEVYNLARQKFNMGMDLPDESPSFAKAGERKIAIGADVKSLGKVLGTALYKGDIAPIATKELLQNSLDAVRHLGENGEVKAAIVDGEKPYIEISDNGNGMTKKELESVFTDLGASGKREDESSIGGFGLAKAAPLLGGQKSVTTSVAREADGKLYRHDFGGTPDELLEGVKVNSKQVPEGTPTGTKVRVYVKPGSDLYGARQFAENVSNYSQGIKGKIKLATTPYNREVTEADYKDITPSKNETKPLTTISNPSADVSITIPPNAKNGTRTWMNMHLANNGMVQKTATHYFKGEVPNAPSDIIVNVKSKVPETHPDYPFTANRESLRGTVEDKVKKYIEDNIVKPSQLKRKDELQKLYDTMPEITVGKGEFPNNFGRKVPIYDAGDRFSPEERNRIYSMPEFHSLINDITDVGGEVLQTMKDKMMPDTYNRLEKMGIIFEDSLHGVHIPNPGTKKSMILINPFQTMLKSTPDEAAGNIVHTILHEMAHVKPDIFGSGHNEAFTINLGNIYNAFGARNEVKALDKITIAITNPDNPEEYNTAIQEILLDYQARSGRSATSEDLLTGTGIKQTASDGSEEDVSFSRRDDGEGTPTERAVNKLFDALDSARNTTSEQEEINRFERARRFAAFEGVKSTGVEGAKKSLGKLSGEYEKVEPGERLRLNKNETDALFTAVKRANITTPEKARGYTSLFKLLNGESLQRNEIKLLDDVFGNGFGNKILELHGGLGTVGLKISKVANTMKSMMTLVHLSAPLRQGLGLIHKAAWRDSFMDMFKFLGNKEYYDAAMQAIEDRPNYLLARQAGLFMSKPSDMLAGEEAFMNNYMPQLPYGAKSLFLRNAYEASQRAYLGFLNKLRADTFDDLIDESRKMGNEVFTTSHGESEEGERTTNIVPSKATEDIAKFINNATGRGSLGKLDKIVPELNAAIWSPRLIASRINILNPKYYTDFDDFTRKEAIKSLFAIAAAGGTAVMMAKLAGGKVNTDPTNADFMKARFGKNVLDPWGGYQQPIVAALRVMNWAAEREEGKKSRYNDNNPLDITTNFIRSKESPMANLIDSIATAKQFTGGGGYINRFNQKTSIQKENMNRFTPIFLQDISNLVKEDNSFAEDLGLGTANLFGAGVQDYPERQSTGSVRFNRMRIR